MSQIDFKKININLTFHLKMKEVLRFTFYPQYRSYILKLLKEIVSFLCFKAIYQI